MPEPKHSISALIPFKFQGHEISVITHDAGGQWFVAKEVCAVLGVENVSMAVSRLDTDEKSIIIVDTLGGPQEALIISEPGFYRLTGSSRKQIAKEFQRWVFHEVLPTIRKTGAYSMQAPTPAQAAVAIAQAVLAVEQRVEAIEARQVSQAASIAALQERQPPEGRMTVYDYLRRYSKPRLPETVFDTFKYHCRQTEKPVWFRPDGRDNASPYYTLLALDSAYAEATRQLSFLAGRRA